LNEFRVDCVTRDDVNFRREFFQAHAAVWRPFKAKAERWRFHVGMSAMRLNLLASSVDAGTRVVSLRAIRSLERIQSMESVARRQAGKQLDAGVTTRLYLWRFGAPC
jgi:hypothetical protein